MPGPYYEKHTDAAQNAMSQTQSDVTAVLLAMLVQFSAEVIVHRPAY